MTADPNRRALAEEMQMAVERIERSRTSLGVAEGHVTALGYLVRRHIATILEALSGREVEAMRERCATIAQQTADRLGEPAIGKRIAAEIRALSQEGRSDG